MVQRRLERRIPSVEKAQQWLARQQDNFSAWETHKTALQDRLERFQAENATNPAPIEAIFRLDAGFGTQENLALLIEMGYEIYSKPYGNWLSGLLAEKSTDPQDWQRVGANAEMKAWKEAALPDFPYPLDLGAMHFWQGNSCRNSALLHFGQRCQRQLEIPMATIRNAHGL